MPKKIIYASFAACGLVGVAALVDIVAGIPFGGNMIFDILFLITAGVVAYMGYDTLKEIA